MVNTLLYFTILLHAHTSDMQWLVHIYTIYTDNAQREKILLFLNWDGSGRGGGLDDNFREIVHILFKFSLNGSKTPCSVMGSDLFVDLLELQLAFSELIPLTLRLAWQIVLIHRWRWDTRKPAGHCALLFNGQSFIMPCGMFCKRHWFVLIFLGC